MLAMAIDTSLNIKVSNGSGSQGEKSVKGSMKRRAWRMLSNWYQELAFVPFLTFA